jgi:hypothetical protein
MFLVDLYLNVIIVLLPPTPLLSLPLAVLLLHHPLVLSLRWLVVTSPLLVLSLCRPLVLLLLRLFVASPLDVLPSCYLFVSSCCPLVVLTCQLVVASSLIVLLLRCPLVLSSRRLVIVLPLLAPPSCPLIVPAIFALPLPCRSPLPTSSNAVERLPPLNATTTAAIERRLYCPPLPQLLSIATVKCQHPPLSIATVKC